MRIPRFWASFSGSSGSAGRNPASVRLSTAVRSHHALKPRLNTCHLVLSVSEIINARCAARIISPSAWAVVGWMV